MVAVARGQITIWVCMDGDDAYNAWVSPSSIAVPALATGEVSETDLGPSSNAVFSVFASKGISSLKMSYSDGVAAEGTCNWRIGTCAGVLLEHVEGSEDKLCVTDISSDFAAGIIVLNLEGKQTVNLQVTVVKQKQGDAGISVSGGGHFESSKCPYKPATLVTAANCVFISNVETSNPPLAISRFKNGNYRRKRGGGYILAGKSADFTVHPDWTLLLDGRELKGTSITFLGAFSSAPSNPVDGNSYYNTTDKCTYIYQNGIWMVMVSDGRDGRNYEWIYTRNNIIADIPDKPDSPQEDDYVPKGWTDNFLGVTVDFQVEWACKRTKKDGVWSEWSTPAVVHRWSKDGENAILADLDSEMVNCALTYDGKASKAQSWSTNVTIWYGTEAAILHSVTATQPPGFTVVADKDTGRVTVSVSQGTAVPETTNIEITLVAQISGQNYERKLTFTVAGVRAGSNGADAVLYSLLPSVSSVTKDKNGSYSVSSVSCTRLKTIGGAISDTTDGVLKYCLDGGDETAIDNGIPISVTKFSRFLKFSFYISDRLVDVETIPMISDGSDGSDGTGITPRGNWVASSVPYYKNDLVGFAFGTFLALRDTTEPPLSISRFKNGNYRRKRGGGYILAGKSADLTVHQDWQMMTPPDNNASYWLDTPVSSIGISSVGIPSPSSFQVTCRMSIHGNTQYCSLFYLAARKYNGTWTLHVSPEQTYKLMVPATSGYTQFLIRAYRSLSDANAWNDNFVCEKGVGVSVDGADGAFLYDCGPWKAGTSYIWNDVRRDKVIHPFDGVYYNFLVKAKGMTVTAAPSSVSGDTNWEAANKFTNIATDTLFADGANVANFMFKGGVMRSQNETDGVPNMILNGKTGYFHCIDADIKGKVVATSGSFENVTVKNISSPNNAFRIDAAGNVQITGKFQTAASGNRVVIDPSNNTLSFVTSGGVANCAISFGTYGGYSTANIFLRSSSGSTIYDSASIAPHEIRLSDKMVSGSVKINCNELSIAGNNKTAIFGADEISIQVGSTKYTGFTGYIETNKVSGGKPVNAHFYRGILYKVSTGTN